VKIAQITANSGNFDVVHESIEQQGVYIDSFVFTDKNFPPRKLALHPRMQAKIPKMFGWQMVPGYDVYLWIDASFVMAREDTAKWMVEQLDVFDIALFHHPHRNTVKEEFDFIKLHGDTPYLKQRYEGELDFEIGVPDTELFASTYFIYRNNSRVHNMMKEWWYYTSRYHVLDQLPLPQVLRESACTVKVIQEDVYANKYFRMVRP
jgi:hypothetical protein